MPRKTDKKAGTKPKNNMVKKANKRNEATNTAIEKPIATAPSADGQTAAQVIPFRQPGWDKHNPWLTNQQVKNAANGFAPVAQRYNHSRGK